MKRDEEFDLICHECDAKLDHRRLRWKQKKSIYFNTDEDNEKHLMSAYTCSSDLADHLFHVEMKLEEFRESIPKGAHVMIENLLEYIKTHSDVQSDAYKEFLSYQFLRVKTGKKFDPESELPHKIFGLYEFLRIANCPKCKSELETPWLGVESIERSYKFEFDKDSRRSAKCTECGNHIQYKKQFWYIYFTKDSNEYIAHIVTICQKCKSEHNHQGGYYLNFRYIR